VTSRAIEDHRAPQGFPRRRQERPARRLRLKLESLESRASGGAARVSARIRWEDSGREPFDLAFDAEGDAAQDVCADPSAILLAAAIPAMRWGERRIAIEGTVCPRLRDGLGAAAAILRAWYGPPRLMPAIEPSAGFAAPVPPPDRGSAAFLSGGMDSLDVFLRNRCQFPDGHPSRLVGALHVSGLPYTGPPGSSSHESFVGRSRSAAAAMARGLGVPLTFVRTNLADIDRDFLFFRQEYFGSAYAAIAQLFWRRFASVSFASAQQYGFRLDPLGSHPLLDPLYSTGALAFRHEGAERTRLQKAETLATRPDLLPDLHVCLKTPLESAGRNCGRCEKCLHTQIELLLAGAPAAAAAFPSGALGVEAIRAIPPDPHTTFFWRPLPPRLRQAGRNDLADAIERKLEEMERTRDWVREAGWRGKLRSIDRRYLGSALVGMRRAMLGRRRPRLPGAE